MTHAGCRVHNRVILNLSFLNLPTRLRSYLHTSRLRFPTQVPLSLGKNDELLNSCVKIKHSLHFLPIFAEKKHVYLISG